MNVQYEDKATIFEHVESPTICQEICQNYPSCVVWTYVYPKCKIMDSSKIKRTELEYRDVVSGPKNCLGD